VRTPRPSNGSAFPGWSCQRVRSGASSYLAMADMSDGDTFYFALGLAAGVALLWVVTETIWMRLY